MRNAAAVCSLAAGTILLTFVIASPVNAQIELPVSDRVARMEAQHQWSLLYSNFFAVMDAVERCAIYDILEYPEHPQPLYPVIADITAMLPGGSQLLLNPMTMAETEPSSAIASTPGAVGYGGMVKGGWTIGYSLNTFGRTEILVSWAYIPDLLTASGESNDRSQSDSPDQVAEHRSPTPFEVGSTTSEPILGIAKAPSTSTSTVFAAPLINGAIHVLHEHRGALIVGGIFDQVGTQSIANLAAWKDGGWHDLNVPMQDYEHVYALGSFDGNLVVGVGSMRWEETNHRVLVAGPSGWRQLGEALPEAPRSLVVFNDELFVGLRSARTVWGESPLYRWTGDNWESCGVPPEDLMVNVTDMVAFEDHLYVGGSFLEDVQSSTFSRGVRRWRDGVWENAGDGLLSEQAPLTRSLPYSIQGVHDLTVFHGKLYATGNFVQESTGTAGLASWDGTRWQPLPSVGTGYQLVIHDDQLVPVGILAHDFGDGNPKYHLGGWNGVQWTELESGGMETTWADPVAIAAASFEGELVLARDTFASTIYLPVVVPSLSAWNGSLWHSLIQGESPLGQISSMLVFDDKLIAGGSFEHVGGQQARLIAAWDGGSWSTLGRGFSPRTMRDRVRSLSSYNGDLIASGKFGSEFDPDINSIARWDGSKWSALTSESGALAANEPSTSDFSVSAMVDYESELVVAGTFSYAGGSPTNGLARWDGQSWNVNIPGTAGITALAVYRGDLYAGGSFIEIDGVPVRGIARWNGTEWSWVRGVREFAAMTVHADRLIISGLVRDHEGQFSQGVGEWDGNFVSFLGGTTDLRGEVGSPPVSLLSHDGLLYASGRFRTIGGYGAPFTAIWNGSYWRSAGCVSRVTAATFNNRLFVSDRYVTADRLTEIFLMSCELATATSTPPAERPSSASHILSASPNPFNPSTTIEFTLAVPGDVTLDLYDVAGRRVRRLESRLLSPGTHFSNWNGRDDTGKTVASGVYNAVLRTPDGQDTRRITLLK